MKKKRRNIGGNIKNFRELKELTREQMAHDLNLSVSAYGNIERNQTDLTISRILKIADILEVDVSQILNFDTSHVFKIEHNDILNTGKHPQTEYYSPANEYRDKYIKMLEAENEQLKAFLKEKYRISTDQAKAPFLVGLIGDRGEEKTNIDKDKWCEACGSVLVRRDLGV